MRFATPKTPNQIDSNPIAVQTRIIRQCDCPNINCDSSLDITHINVGTKIQCGACGNFTWLPDYKNQWWKKPINILVGLVLSFIIGVAASITAHILTSNVELQIPALPLKQESSSRTNLVYSRCQIGSSPMFLPKNVAWIGASL